MARPQVFFKNGSTTEEAVYTLQRIPRKAGKYRLLEQFDYRDPVRPDRAFTVPKDPATFETDLASIPPVATWLVPKDGTHTPAALLHDALMPKKKRPKAYIGPDISRLEADVVFREAMHYLGVGFLRRWMMWATVSMATLCTPDEKVKGRHWWYRPVVALVAAFFLVGGFFNVLDVFDVRIDVPFRKKSVTLALPWIGEGPIGTELRSVAWWTAVATVVSLVLWLRHFLIGLIAAVGLSVFGFPLLLAGIGFGVYAAAEFLLFVALSLLPKKSAWKPVNPPRLLRRMAE